MKRANDTSRATRWGGAVAVLALLVSLVWAYFPSDHARAQPFEKKPHSKQTEAEKPISVWEVRCLDDSALRLVLLDDKIELETPFGKLQIPAAQIRRIDFAWRNPADVDKRIGSAVEELGNSDFKRREEATEQLAEIGERAYPALLVAAKHKDLEISRRAEELLQKLRDDLPAERLEARPHDVVHTEHSKIAGRIVAVALKVKTAPFGEQELKLTDVRSLRAPGAVDVDPANAMQDPGSLSRQEYPLGKVLTFKVTAAQGGGHGGVWGTGIYTVDSTLAAAAVHAGALRPGQSGLVRVTLVGPVPQFVGSTQNGVTSSGWGTMPGFRIER